MKIDSSKYFAIVQLETTIFVADFDPANGNLNEAREIAFPSLTFTSQELNAGGAASDNMLVCSTLTSSSQYHIITFINTDSWTLTSFKASGGSITLLGFSEFFNTDQIVLAYDKDSSEFFSIQASYDKLNYTELYTS